jgi:hypothetical protein
VLELCRVPELTTVIAGPAVPPLMALPPAPLIVAPAWLMTVPPFCNRTPPPPAACDPAIKPKLVTVIGPLPLPDMTAQSLKPLTPTGLVPVLRIVPGLTSLSVPELKKPTPS